MALQEREKDSPRPLHVDKQAINNKLEDLASADDCPSQPNNVALMGPQPIKKRLVAPALSLTLSRSDTVFSDDFPTAALSPSADDDDLELNIDLDAMETPTDNEFLQFPTRDLEWDDEQLHVERALYYRTSGSEQAGVGPLEQDQVDSQGCVWRKFCTGELGQDSLVNMSVLEPYLQVLSHGGYYGDGLNDIIVFSACYLPENNLKNYQYIMDNLFRYIVGTLDLMVAENFVIVCLCAVTPRNKLPGLGWLRECHNTIDRRLKKNLKGLYVVHPTWYIKALITIIKPFISSKFSRKLQFIGNLRELSRHIPVDHMQIPACVTQFDENMDR